MAAMLPDLDDLDLNQLDGISSLIPSQDKKAKEMEEQNRLRQQQMNQQRIMQQQQQMQSSPWYIQENDKNNYERIFGHFDTENNGMVGAQEM